MSKKQSLGKDAVVLTSSKVLSLAIAMVSSMLLSRFRTLEEYGTYSQILLVISLATSIFTLGLPNSLNFFLAKAKEDTEKGEFLSTYYTFNTALCVLMGAVLTLCTPLIVQYFKNTLISSFWYVLAVLPWANVITSSIDNVLIVYHKTDKLMLFRLLNSIFLLLSIVVIQVFHLTFYHYMILYVVVQSGFAIAVYILVKNLSRHVHFHINWGLVRTVLAFSLPLGLSAILSTINIELDKLVIGRLLGTEEVAIYTNAGKELPITIVSSSITAILLPQIVRLINNKRKDAAVRLWGDGTVIGYAVLCFFAISMVVYAPQVITVLYSEKYLPGVGVFRIYSLVLILRSTYFGMLLNAFGKTRLIFYSSLISIALNAVLNILFYYIFGFVGPALATLVCIGLVGLLQLAFSARCVEVPFRKILPWKKLLKITLVNLVIGALGYAVIRFFQIGTSARDVAITIGIGVAAVLLYGAVMFKPLKRIWRSLDAPVEEE